MPEAALFIGWGQAVRGREHQALQVFGEALAFYTRLQQEGEITGFEPVSLEPHGGELVGFFLVRGDRERLQRVRASEEFRRLHNRANHIVDHLGVVTAFVGDDLQWQFADWGAQAQDLG